jgi:apolipoprotein N-acyltransferase
VSPPSEPKHLKGSTRRWDLYGTALILGLLHAASFAPLDSWLLALVCLTGLFVLVRIAQTRCARPHMTGALTWTFGLGWFGAGLSWLFVSMHQYGGMPAPLAAAAVLLFASYLAGFSAIAAGLADRLWQHSDGVRLALGWTALWTGAEWARGQFLTGFPWLAVGYSQIDGPLASLAPLLGVHGIGAATVLLATLLATLIPPRWPWARHRGSAAHTSPSVRQIGRATAGAATLVGAALLVPPELWTHPFGAPLHVRLIQGNIPQDMKFQPDQALAAMHTYTELFEQTRAPLTILPETAWTSPWPHTPLALQSRIFSHARKGHALALGLPFWSTTQGEDRPPSLTNSVLLINPTTDANTVLDAPRYDKHHLVPFGEFIPNGFGWFVRTMNIPLGNFARGAAMQPPLHINGQTIAFNICYEDLFGEELRSVLLGPEPATILANVSNIAWFGATHALPQHLAIARMRSLETGRPMLRATNTGMTALINAQGQVVAELAPHTRGVLDVWVQGTSGLTPYARLGNGPVLILAGLLGLLAWPRRLRPSS